MSPSTSFQHFAVAGAIGGSGNDGPGGKIGADIVTALINAGADVRVLARASSAETVRAAELRSQGVGIAVVDYEDPGSMKNELATDSTALDKDSLFYPKRKVQLHLRSIGLHYTLFFTGLFAEWIPHFVTPREDGKLEIVGDGKPPISFTAQEDIGRYVAHVLTTLPPDELNDRIFSVEGSRASLLDLVPLLENKAGKIELVHVSVDEAIDRFQTKGMFFEFIKALWAQGKGVSGTKSQANETRALFEDWNPRPIQAFLQ